VTRTRKLSGAGLIHNATRCSITSGEIRTLPEYTAPRTPTSSPRQYTCQTAHQYCQNMSSPCRRGAHTRGQRSGPAEGPPRNRTEVARRRHVGTHSESHPSPRNTAPLASDNHISLLRIHSPAGTWDVSPLKFSVCCLMLPAHKTRPQKKILPGPQRIQFRLQKTQPPTLMRNHDATA